MTTTQPTATRNQPSGPARLAINGPMPAWLPRGLVARCGGTVSGSFRFSEAERQVLRKRKMESPSDWAAKHRYVRLSSIPGKWKHTFSPYLAPLMDALRFPGVETGIICKAPQTGVTDACVNMLGHAADHFPGPAMVVYPDKDTARDICNDRIKPMFEDSPRLRKHLKGNLNEESSIRVNLRHMSILLGWSGSVSRLGSRPIRLLILDELNKYIDSTREASSEALAEKRTITWRGKRLIIKLSTPTTETGAITVAFEEEAHCRFDWHVICPECGGQQLMKFDNIRWPETVRDPRDVEGGLAWYGCEHCEAQWDDEARNKAVRLGQWLERGTGLELFTHLETHKPGKIAFHIPSWLSYFVSLSEVAAAFLKYQKSKRLKDLKDFMNSHKAEPWAEEYAAREEDAILALCDDRPRGTVPGPLILPGRSEPLPRVAALVAGIDTQAAYFRFVIRAFGYGSDEESWLVKAGTAATFKTLDEQIWKSVYPDPAGREYKVRAAVIDAMGAPGRTKQVYAWCGRWPLAMAYQGKQSLAAPVAYSPIAGFANAKGHKTAIPHTPVLRRADTTFFKSDLAEKLGIVPGDPGAFWLHENTKPRLGGADSPGILAEYAKEMCAETFNPETLIWENPKKRPNHFWDCEVMCLVAAWELGLRNKKPPAPKAEAEQPKARPRPQPIARPQSAGERLAALSRR